MKISDEQLLKILKAEETDATSYHNSELAKSQEEAIKRYYGDAYGDEAEGRSKVVMKDLQTTIQWIMPDLMRTFRASGELITVASESPEDDAPIMASKSKVDIQAAYLEHVMFKDNKGAIVIHDMAFDGLLNRVGVARVAWKDPEAKPPRIIEGVLPEQLQKYTTDPQYKILEAEEGEGGAFNIKVQHTPRMGKALIEGVPSEEFAIKRTSKSIDESDYHRRKRKVFVADLIRQFPDAAARLRERKKIAGEDDDIGSDGRFQARHDGEEEADAGDEGRERCTLIEEFIRIDMDGDDVVELRHIKRVGSIILENEAVESSEYVSWTPSRISHKWAGLSLHDVLADLQKIRTVVMRRYLDGLGQTLTPQKYVNVNKISQEHGTIEALQANEIGGVIFTEDDPNAVVKEVVTPDISGPALSAMEFADRLIQETSGVTKHAQGMDPEAMNKTATGIDLLQAAAKTRIEMVATWLGMAVEEMLSKVNRLLVYHQDGQRQVKLFGQFIPVDPRTWSDEAAISVHVGSAGVSRQQRLANLAMISQKQEQILLQAPNNPIVSLQHYRTTLAEMVSTMGFKDTSAFFGEVPQDYQPPQQEDPKAAEAKAKLEVSVAESQAKMQLSAQEGAQKLQFEREKAAAEMQLAREKAAAEMQLARDKMAMEFDLRREEIQVSAETQRQIGMRKASLNGSDSGGLSDDRPGGSLAQ